MLSCERTGLPTRREHAVAAAERPAVDSTAGCVARRVGRAGSGRRRAGAGSRGSPRAVIVEGLQRHEEVLLLFAQRAVAALVDVAVLQHVVVRHGRRPLRQASELGSRTSRAGTPPASHARAVRPAERRGVPAHGARGGAARLGGRGAQRSEAANMQLGRAGRSRRADGGARRRRRRRRAHAAASRRRPAAGSARRQHRGVRQKSLHGSGAVPRRARASERSGAPDSRANSAAQA